MWMLVNITIFGDAATMQEMITALEYDREFERFRPSRLRISHFAGLP